MRRTLGILTVALSLLIGLWPGGARADAPPLYVCDGSGPVTIERYFNGGSPHFPVFTYRWTVFAEGTCRDQSGGIHDLQMRFYTNFAESTDPGLCGTAGVSPANNGNSGFGASGSYASFHNRATGEWMTLYYASMSWLPNSVTSSVSPITMRGTHWAAPGVSITYLGEGIEANRIFLKCPTSYPSSENGRFIFTLHQDPTNLL